MQATVKFLFISLLSFGLMSCAMTNEGVGALTGGAVGGLIGSRFGHGGGRALAIAGGTMAGVIIGSNIGRYMDRMDRADRRRWQHALEKQPDHRATTWTNPNPQRAYHRPVHYRVEPTRTYYVSRRNGYESPCREYHMTAMVGGKKQQIYGKACRQSDGSWKVQN